MDCPRCGYAMDPFDIECPRCMRLGPQAVATRAPVPSNPPLEPESFRQSPPHLAGQAPDERIVLPPLRYVPPLGWLLTITLWVALIIQGAFLGAVTLAAIGVQVLYHDDPHAGIPILIVLGLFPAVRLVSLMFLLRCQRWAFYLFLCFTAAPLFWNLMIGRAFHPFDWVNLAITLIIVVMSLAKWKEFE